MSFESACSFLSTPTSFVTGVLGGAAAGVVMVAGHLLYEACVSTRCFSACCARSKCVRCSCKRGGAPQPLSGAGARGGA
jgi:hypothetical protein